MIIDKETFLSTEYIEGLFSTGRWSEHGSDLSDFYNENDITSTEEHEALLKFLPHRYDFAMKYLAKDLAGTDAIILMRSLYMSTDELKGITPGSTANVGKYWTVSNPEPYGAICTDGKVLVTVKAKVQRNQINILETMRSRMDYVHGDYEMEIQLNAGEEVEILMVHY